MYIDRVQRRESSYQAKADKKTMVNLKNTFRKPPMGNPKGAYVLMMTFEGMPGYTPRDYDKDLIR